MPPPRGHDFWAPLVRAVLDGDAIAAVARRHNVSNSALGYWVSKAKKAAGPSAFLPVRVVSPPRVSHASVLELRVQDVRLRFPAGTEPAYLASVLAALRSC